MRRVLHIFTYVCVCVVHPIVYLSELIFTRARYFLFYHVLRRVQVGRFMPVLNNFYLRIRGIYMLKVVTRNVPGHNDKPLSPR